MNKEIVKRVLIVLAILALAAGSFWLGGLYPARFFTREASPHFYYVLPQNTWISIDHDMQQSAWASLLSDKCPDNVVGVIGPYVNGVSNELARSMSYQHPTADIFIYVSVVDEKIKSINATYFYSSRYTIESLNDFIHQSVTLKDIDDVLEICRSTADLELK